MENANDDRVSLSNPSTSSDYDPSLWDLYKVHGQTIGAERRKFEIRGNHIYFMLLEDIESIVTSGVHWFSKVDAMIFTASLTSMNKVLFEDQNHNGMQETH